MKITASVVLLLAVAQVRALPSGAPSTACPNIVPQGHINSGIPNAGELTGINFTISSNFPGDVGVQYYYCAEQTYTLTLAGDGGEQFRGLLVQGRNMEGMPVGTFSNFGDLTRASSCPIPESAVTHNSREFKTTQNFTWNAPAEGTGPILFRYAVVVGYVPANNINEFYAPLETGYIMEAPLASMFCAATDPPTTATTDPPTTATTEAATDPPATATTEGGVGVTASIWVLAIVSIVAVLQSL